MARLSDRLRVFAALFGKNSLSEFRPAREFDVRGQVKKLSFAIVTGLVVGHAAWGFRELYGLLQFAFFGDSAQFLADFVLGLPWWHVVLAPTLGGLLLALFLKYLMPGGRVLGVADVIEAGLFHNGRMSFRAGVGAAFASALALGSGSSVGREGPVVHLGASLASVVTKLFNLNRLDGNSVLACGVAAGVGASFNAPIAAVIFAHEVVLGHYALRALAPVVISAVVGTMVTRVHTGDFPAFLIPDYQNYSIFEFPGFMLLGLMAGATALVFFWAVPLLRNCLDTLKLPNLWRPPLAGLCVGLIALGFPEVLGVGYGPTSNALNHLYALDWLLLLLLAKMVATVICVAGGFGAGVFSPALFMGAMLGGAFGLVAAAAFPGIVADQGLYSVVGMGAFASAILGAPVSTTLIVFELTGDYRITLAMMLAVVLASLVARQFRHRSFFYWQLAARAISLTEADTAMLHARTISGVLLKNVETINAGMTFGELRKLYRESPALAYFVVDTESRITGVLVESDIRFALLDPGLDDLGLAIDIASQPGDMLIADTPLDEALEAFHGGVEHQFLPVIDSIDEPRVLGIVRYTDVLAAHNEVLKEAIDETR